MLTAGSDEDGCVNEEEAEESVQSSIQGTVLVECNPQDGLPEELGRGNNSWLQAMDIARSIRKCLWEELQFTCSIGISPNKTLSKLLSSSNKPDKQSILLPSLIDKYMATVPLQKIRQFGGKLGEQIRQTFGVENAGELQRFSLEELSSGLQSKEQAKFLFNICRGICNDAVESNSCHSKSITSAKALQPPHNQSIAAMEGTLRLLASDIYQRLDRLRLERKEWPKTLTISSTNATSMCNCVYL